MRLGVAAALVDGEVVEGEVEVDPELGTVAGVGLPPGGTGLALPGFVDLQVNGVGDIDLRTCGPEGYGRAASQLAAAGVTSALPTFHSQPLEAHRSSLQTLAEVLVEPPAGCRFLPAHLEGPFLSAQRAGAHDPLTLLPPDPRALDELLDAGPVGFMTLAPELPGALSLVPELRERDVTVSIGHTDADAATVRAAVDAGARHLTHCWNAHRPLTARDPGPAGVALSDPRVSVGLIADLAHVAPEVVLLTLHAAAGRVAITADPVALGAGLEIAGGVARHADGTIAGGAVLLDTGFRNLVGLGVDLAAASDACGGAQRRLLGLPAVRCRPGDVADLVVLDESFRVVRTLVGGVEVWASC